MGQIQTTEQHEIFCPREFVAMNHIHIQRKCTMTPQICNCGVFTSGAHLRFKHTTVGSGTQLGGIRKTYHLQIACGLVVLAEQIAESRPVSEGLWRVQKLAQLGHRDGAQQLHEETHKSEGLRQKMIEH